MAASATDVARLKQLADQAVARYAKDKAAADQAVRLAEKAMDKFETVKATLEEKVQAGKTLQSRIRALQDSLSAQRAELASTLSAREVLQEKARSAKAKVTSAQNELTVAKVAAQKAKVKAEKAALAADRFNGDVDNANKVADANDLAVAAAAKAAIDIEASSNSLDQIVSSEIVDSSVKSLPAIMTAIGTAVVVTFLTFAAIRRTRRRKHPVLAPVEESFPEMEIDFDRILKEIKEKQAKSAAKKRPQSRK